MSKRAVARNVQCMWKLREGTPSLVKVMGLQSITVLWPVEVYSTQGTSMLSALLLMPTQPVRHILHILELHTLQHAFSLTGQTLRISRSVCRIRETRVSCQKYLLMVLKGWMVALLPKHNLASRPNIGIYNYVMQGPQALGSQKHLRHSLGVGLLQVGNDLAALEHRNTCQVHPAKFIDDQHDCFSSHAQLFSKPHSTTFSAFHKHWYIHSTLCDEHGDTAADDLPVLGSSM